MPAASRSSINSSTNPPFLPLGAAMAFPPPLTLTAAPLTIDNCYAIAVGVGVRPNPPLDEADDSYQGLFLLGCSLLPPYVLQEKSR